MFERVLIANRGEIACRVIRTCHRLGIRTIAVYSEADRHAQHVLQADEAWPIGGAAPADSYLRIDTIIDVAKQAGAQAIHPGYGFLSENADFSRACAEAGIAFIGPAPESIEAMGSKAGAKALMEKHDVPLVPGYHGADQDADVLAREAVKTGFPLMIKPAAGGGGKGMHIVRRQEDFADTLATAQRESQGAFGDARVILERYIEHPRHIEFQIFGDPHGNVVHLNERECSSQRRFQKVLEETPSPFLNAERRARMGKAAVAAAKAVDYVGAGTIEFIVGADGDFFFMEMNTRLQVEHPVTEMTLGLDLVEWQLRVAAGEPLPLTQDQIHAQDGHAIEVRLYAEDPDHNFLPASGRLDVLKLPQPSAHVRLDGGVIEGDTVSIFYDPMIAKLIVHDVDRPSALQRMRDVLARCEVIGPKTNVAFLERLVSHPIVVAGNIDTGYLDAHLSEFLETGDKPPERAVMAATCAWVLHVRDNENDANPAADPHSPWSRRDSWEIGHGGFHQISFVWHDARVDVDVTGRDGNFTLAFDDQHVAVSGAHLDGGVLGAHVNKVTRHFPVTVTGRRVTVHDDDGLRHVFDQVPRHTWESGDDASGDQIAAPMPGRIVLVKHEAGDAVEQDQEIIVMEAMKMELALKAPRAGTIDAVTVKAGDFVDADTVLVRFAQD